MKKITKDSKYENEQRTLKDRPRTDAPDRSRTPPRDMNSAVDPLHVPEGPITRSKVKKIQEALISAYNAGICKARGPSRILAKRSQRKIT